MTYQQAYDKIIQAYFKNQIKPYIPSFCFCGTLCDNKATWFNQNTYYENLFACEPVSQHRDFGPYSGAEYARMEIALLMTLELKGSVDRLSEAYEEKLFKGMCAALDVLKEIHRSRGEDVDSLPALTKRTLSI